MVRKSVRLTGRLALSAAISWTLIPIASADAPPAKNATAAEQPAVTSDDSGQAPQKILHTVPEDGMGDTKWLSGATRFVRETLSKRPKEDLVICIGGCVPKQDRIVYAQPSEYVPPKPENLMSDAKPTAPAAAAAAAAAPVKPAQKPETKSAKAPAVESTPAKSDQPVTAPAAMAPAAVPDARTLASEPAKTAAPEAKNAAATPATAPVSEPAMKPVTAPLAQPIAPAPPIAAEARPALAPAAAAARPEEMKKLEFVPSASQPHTGGAPAAVESDEDTTIPQEDRPKARQRPNHGTTGVMPTMPR